jgi:hypothetical protein
LGSAGITIKHVFQVSIMAFLAWTLVVSGVREQCIETKADQKGFADLT